MSVGTTVVRTCKQAVWDRGGVDRHDENKETSVSEGTTFMQWRERAQSEVQEERPRMRALLITAAVVVVVGIVVGVIVLLAA